MFVLCHTGLSLDAIESDDPYSALRTLIQRNFILDLISVNCQLEVATLDQVEFVDSKMLSFLYERKRASEINEIPPNWATAVSAAVASCNKLEAELSPSKCSATSPPNTRKEWLIGAAKDLLAASGDPLDRVLAFLFVGIQLGLTSLSLSQRAQYICPIDPKLGGYLRSTFCPNIFRHLARIPKGADFFPDLDGNIFLVLLNCVIDASNASLDELLGSSLANELASCWSSAGLPVPDLTLLLLDYSHIPPPVASNSPAHTGTRLLPFSHPVFDEYLPVVDQGGEPQNNASRNLNRIQKLCNEGSSGEKHWHNAKSILPKHLGGQDGYNPQVVNKDKEKAKRRRDNQIFMTNIQRQAETLTGAKGKQIQRISIIGSRPSTPLIKNPGVRSRAPSLSQSQPPSPLLRKKASLRLIAQNDADKQIKKLAEDDLWWNEQLNAIQKIPEAQAQLKQLEFILNNKRTESGWLAVEIHMFQIHLQIRAWLADAQGTSPAARETYTVQILRSIHAIMDHPSLFPAAANKLETLLTVLGFETLDPPQANLEDNRQLNFAFVELIDESGKPRYPHFRISMSPSEFQLEFYGEYMDRSMDSKPDSRVRFQPDGWQREVLDKIDRRESVLVVAPTSAGKTFSSFYAMEKVLREDNKGVVVYVSPTKALCQQIAADIHARFKKSMKGMSTWAIHTRDYRVHDPLKTQILITVPEILDIMLLSPALAKTWVPRLKYIILDEIHLIGQVGDGQVWEHIILLSNCPVIGLSATIGEPEAFSGWLRSVQEAHGLEYSMIEHRTRYSHLRKLFWRMPDTQSYRPFRGLQTPLSAGHQLSTIHPMSVLVHAGTTIPLDLALEPRDCLSLYLMMLSCVPPEQLAYLDPPNFFSDEQHRFLKQSDVIKYEEALKQVVSQWAQSQDANDPQSPYQRLLGELQINMNSNGLVEAAKETRSDDGAAEDFIDLLRELQANGDLPCLAFNFDRSGCENVAKRLLERLQEGEQAWKNSNAQWMEKVERWNSWKATARMRERQAKRASRQKPEGDEEPSSSNSGWEETFNPDDPLPEFSFVEINLKGTYTRENIDKDLRRSKGWPGYLVLALQRGIAVHHAGLPKSYRSVVESLFRVGYCRVMISTGTLAHGINAPARSVIFVGDSPHLNATMYRQCGGRAGRRGFDLLGKIIFYNMPLGRAHRLMISRIPPLTGNWPLTTTLCLRLLNLLSASDQAPSAVDAVHGLLRLPRLSVSSDQTRQEVFHHMRFSIEYLRRVDLLSNTGQTTALFDIVSHLYYEEPGNLAFALLVREGIVHRICSKFREHKRITEDNIVHLVAALFARRPLPHFIGSDVAVDRLRKSSPSRVKLLPLPDYINEKLAHHDQDTLRVFITYVALYAERYLAKDPDNCLPLSGQRINQAAEPFGSLIVEALKRTSIEGCAIRSPFVSTSGKDDAFESIAELCRTAREGVHLNGKVIPSFDFTAPTNAYALDFWQHQSIQPLIDANGLRRSQVWFELDNFSKILATLVAGLRVLLIDSVVTKPKDVPMANRASDKDVVDRAVPKPRESWMDSSESDGSDDEDSQSESFVEDSGVESGLDEVEDTYNTGNGLYQHVDLLNPPDGVPEEDWEVYEAFRSVKEGFNARLKKIGA